MTHHLTRQRAERHEALYPQLQRLTAQVTQLAARRSSAPVPDATRDIARDLLFEAQSFAGARRPRGLPEPAADLGGLATQLGRALSELDAFEAANSAWHAELRCFAWQFTDPLPVRRLRPETAAIIKTNAQKRTADEMRRKIVARFDEKYEEGYEAGFRAAQAAAASQAMPPNSILPEAIAATA